MVHFQGRTCMGMMVGWIMVGRLLDDGWLDDGWMMMDGSLTFGSVLGVVVARIRLVRSATEPSPQLITAAPWASSWCMTSPTRSHSMPSRTGEWVCEFVCVWVCSSWFVFEVSYPEVNPCVNCVARATQIKTYSWDNAQVIMVGNKCDMDEERVVPPEKGKHLADQLGERLRLSGRWAQLEPWGNPPCFLWVSMATAVASGVGCPGTPAETL